jgi:hypothetical protein
MSLRKAIHDLLNKNGNTILPIQVSAEDLETLIKDKPLDPAVKDVLERVIGDLHEVEGDLKIAQSLVNQIKTFVYSKIDPDQNELEITIDDKLMS